MTISTRVAIAVIVENILTLCIFAMIVIFAPEGWKWASIVCVLNLNSIRTNDSRDSQ